MRLQRCEECEDLTKVIIPHLKRWSFKSTKSYSFLKLWSVTLLTHSDYLCCKTLHLRCLTWFWIRLWYYWLENPRKFANFLQCSLLGTLVFLKPIRRQKSVIFEKYFANNLWWETKTENKGVSSEHFCRIKFKFLCFSLNEKKILEGVR